MKLNYDNQNEMLEKVSRKSKKRNYAEILISDFLDSGKKIAKVEEIDNAVSCASNLGRVVKKMGVGDKVTVVRRRNELFFLRKEGGPET